MNLPVPPLVDLYSISRPPLTRLWSSTLSSLSEAAPSARDESTEKGRVHSRRARRVTGSTGAATLPLRRARSSPRSRRAVKAIAPRTFCGTSLLPPPSSKPRSRREPTPRKESRGGNAGQRAWSLPLVGGPDGVLRLLRSSPSRRCRGQSPGAVVLRLVIIVIVPSAVPASAPWSPPPPAPLPPGRPEPAGEDECLRTPGHGLEPETGSLGGPSRAPAEAAGAPTVVSRRPEVEPAQPAPPVRGPGPAAAALLSGPKRGHGARVSRRPRGPAVAPLIVVETSRFLRGEHHPPVLRPPGARRLGRPLSTSSPPAPSPPSPATPLPGPLAPRRDPLGLALTVGRTGDVDGPFDKPESPSPAAAAPEVVCP